MGMYKSPLIKVGLNPNEIAILLRGSAKTKRLKAKLEKAWKEYDAWDTARFKARQRK